MLGAWRSCETRPLFVESVAVNGSSPGLIVRGWGDAGSDAALGVVCCGNRAGSGAFGVFSDFGIGRSSYELCVGNSHMAVEGATRAWLPVVGSSCTYAPSHDERVVQIVFDVPASVFAVGGWVLICASFYSRRRPKPQRESAPIDRG